MQLIRSHVFFGSLSIAFACGPEVAEENTWMLGTFSTRSANGYNIPSVFHYEFREDGTLVVSGVSDYGKRSVEPVEYTWEYLDDESIEVVLAEPQGGVDHWRVSPGRDCNLLRFKGFQGSDELFEDVLHRGKVCLLEGGMCPSGSNCDANMSAYCDDPPPACEEVP